jgi:hypothetical protein
MRAMVPVALLLCLLSAACEHVPATRRGTLAKRSMQFQEDPDELVLENHLIESREGSSGAQGARGGGCGCN